MLIDYNDEMHCLNLSKVVPDQSISMPVNPQFEN